MFREIVLYFDEECIEMFEDAAKQNGVSLSCFLQNAGMVSLIKKDRLPDAGFCIVPKSNLEQHPALAETVPAKKRTSQPKKKTYTLKEETELFDDFVLYLEKKLLTVDVSCFSCRYSLNPENCYPWVPETLCSGESREDNAAMLSLLSEQLLQAIACEDEQRCYETVCCAMDWGHVLYTSGICKGNKVRVDRYYQNHGLLPLLKRSQKHLENHEFELLEECSSGWSMIWYLMDIRHLLILSSRKVYALNKVLLEFCAANKLVELPKSLNFGQLVYQGNSKYIEGIRYVYTLRAKLGLLEKISRITNRLMDTRQFVDTKDVDDRLYILGENQGGYEKGLGYSAGRLSDAGDDGGYIR